MSGTVSKSLSFVGAMKIARTLPLSERHVGWYSPIPAPSLRELSSECETEGVSSVGSSGPMVYPPPIINSEIFERLRSSKYTPSVTPIRACQLPQRGSRERAAPFIGVLAKPWGFGRFSSPLRNSKTVSFYHSSNDTPSVTPFGRDSALREGAGKRYHSSGYSLTSGVTGDFHRPYGNSEWGSFYRSMWGERFVLQSGGGYGIIWGERKNTFQPNKELCKWKF